MGNFYRIFPRIGSGTVVLFVDGAGYDTIPETDLQEWIRLLRAEGYVEDPGHVILSDWV